MPEPQPRNQEITLGRTTLRFYDDGTVDELVLLDETGKCFLHMEQLHDGVVWMKIASQQTDGKSEVVLNFCSKKVIHVRHEIE